MVLFALLCGVCLVVAVAYVGMARLRQDAAAVGASSEPLADAETLARVSSGPRLLFLQTDDYAYRFISMAPLDAANGPRARSALQCHRIHFAAGRGLCLGQYLGGHGAFIFGTDLQPRHTFQTVGIPSRVRVSADGRYGALTVFVAGHSYAQTDFSTQTLLVDMASGETLADLEQFTVFRDGEQFQEVDFNFWGVTFARDSNRFYATLRTGGNTYLVEGDLARREARILREGVECPSLSPDGARLAFKKRMADSADGRPIWNLYLLDLATMQERPLGETRGVDDQVEWLDDAHLLYSRTDEALLPRVVPDIWVLPIDGSAPPRIFQPRALSPVVVR